MQMTVAGINELSVRQKEIPIKKRSLKNTIKGYGINN